MSVRFASPDLLAPLSASYTCRWCGRVAAMHGRDAGRAPAGWVELPEDGDVDHACADCAGEPRPGDRRRHD